MECEECLTYPICRNKILTCFNKHEKRYSVYWSYVITISDICQIPKELYSGLPAEELKQKFEEIFNIKNGINIHITNMINKIYGDNEDGEFKESMQKIWNVKNV